MRLTDWLLLFTLIFIANSQFDVALYVTSSWQNVESRISLNNKQVYMNVDITETFMTVCCKPNRHIFQIIYSFLSNPFFQINQFICPANYSGSQNSQLKLPTLGVITMNYNLIQYPQCSKGTLGLSKQSMFLNCLPVNDHTIKIEIGANEGTPHNKISISLGQLLVPPDNSWIFDSKDLQLWNIQGKSIQLGPLIVDPAPMIIFKSIDSQIKMPSQFYQKITAYYPSNETCKTEGENLLCLCESGIPAYFPKIIINLLNGQKLQIGPQNYMRIDSNICKLLFKPSTDNKWYFNVGFFTNTIFYLDRNQGKVIIQKKQIPNNQSSELISLPIPLILNCAVVLLLCIFASLVIIEIVKRVSGLSEISGESLRQYIMRRNLI